MPDENAAQRFIFRLLWPPTPAGARKHTWLEQLTELRDTREGFLTEDEYTQIRSEFFDQIATPARLPKVQLLILATGALVGLGMSLYFVLHRVPRTAWVGVLPFGVSILMGWRLLRSYARMRSLTKEDRLTALAELAEAELVSIEELADLRGRIERLES
jgi:hypothetical protein